MARQRNDADGASAGLSRQRRPPRMPSDHPSVNLDLQITIHEDSPIWRTLEAAGARLPATGDDESSWFQNAMHLTELRKQIAWHIRDYINASVLAQDDSSFREDLRSLAYVLDGLLGALPAPSSPVVRAVVEKWGDLNGEKDDDTLEGFNISDVGDYERIVASVRSLQEAARAVGQDEGIGRRTGRPFRRAPYQFVLRLADLFQDYSGTHTMSH